MKKVEFIDSIKYHLDILRNRANRKYTIRVYLIKYIPILILLCLDFNIIIKFLYVVGWWVVSTMLFDHRVIRTFDPVIRIWFGVPGSGKTSVGAWLSRESNKNHYKVLSNVPIKDTYKLDNDDLGKYDMSFDDEGCHVILDEATINGLDNRDYKSFGADKKKYFSIHRHMDNMVDVFSQSYDIDLKIKDRAGEKGLFHLSRFALKGFVQYRRIGKIFFIKKDDKQFIDGFKYAGLPRICYTRSVWDSFDTKDKSLCPTEQKEWVLWNV